MSSQLPSFQECREHLLNKLNSIEVGREPFYHLYVEEVFSPVLYQAIKERMIYYRENKKLGTRNQDNAAFINSRYNLKKDQDPTTRLIVKLFKDSEIKLAMLKHFYLDPNEFERSLKIHKEFEYVYTAADRFQNIHIDIPEKMLSLVFYFPEQDLTPEQESHNATILYNRDLQACHQAKYRSNSLCIFVPHFHSYHGFSTTIPRTALVMFYIHSELIIQRRKTAQDGNSEAIKYLIEDKLNKYPLIEYQDKDILAEKEKCRINALWGRVMRDKSLPLCDDEMC